MIDYTADINKITNDCVNWIKDWFADKGENSKAVVAVSGGKDSSVVAALCVKALGKDRVFGVLLPNGVQKDISDSLKLVNHLGIKYCTINIADAVNATIRGLVDAGIDPTEQTLINIPPRERMKTVYAVAQSMNGFVANTCNMSENHVGYATLYGDHAGSFAPLDRLTVTEIQKMGMTLGLPYELVYKIPADGLTEKTDEESLGFTYAELDNYIRNGEITNIAHKELIDKKYKANKFKMNMIHIDYFDPNLPVAIEH